MCVCVCVCVCWSVRVCVYVRVCVCIYVCVGVGLSLSHTPAATTTAHAPPNTSSPPTRAGSILCSRLNSPSWASSPLPHAKTSPFSVKQRLWEPPHAAILVQIRSVHYWRALISIQHNKSSRFWQPWALLLGTGVSVYWVYRGDGRWGKKEKTKIIPGTQSKARAGWPKRLRLVQATPWADFDVITAQLGSTMTTIFSWQNNFAFNYYSRPRF